MSPMEPGGYVGTPNPQPEPAIRGHLQSTSEKKPIDYALAVAVARAEILSAILKFEKEIGYRIDEIEIKWVLGPGQSSMPININLRTSL